MFIDIAVFVGQHIIGRIPVAEAIHVDLIHDRAFCPGRGPKAGEDHKVIVFIDLCHQSSGIVIALQKTGLDLKIVGLLLRSQLQVTGIVVEVFGGFHLVHHILLAPVHQHTAVHIIFGGTKPNGHCGVRLRLRRNQEVSGGIRKECPSVENRAHRRNILAIVFQVFDFPQIQFFFHDFSHLPLQSGTVNVPTDTVFHTLHLFY